MSDDEIRSLIVLGNLPVEFVMVAQECLKRGERIADQKTEIQRLNGLLDAKRGDGWHDDAG